MLRLISSITFKSSKESKLLRIMNPYDGTLVKELIPHSINDIEINRQKLTQARIKWQQLKLSQRNTQILDFIKHVSDHKLKIQSLLTQSIGTTKTDAQQALRIAIQIYTYQTNYQYSDLIRYPHTQNYVKLFPYGNVLVNFHHSSAVLSAFKYLASSLRTGNGIILNPTLQGIPFALKIQSIWNQVSNIPMIYSHCSTSPMNVDHLLKCQDTGFISYSGRIEPGRKLYRLMAQHSQCFAESEFLLGSCDAAYVAPGACLKTAASYIGKGAFSNAGDTFCSIKRVYVHKSISKPFMELLLQQASHFKPGNPSDSSSKLSPIVSVNDYDHYVRTMQRFKDKIEMVTGSSTLQMGRFISPTIFMVRQNCSEIYQNQQYNFPILFVTQTQVAPIEQVNSSNMGNTFSIFTDNEKQALQIGEKINVGLVNVNSWGIEGHLPYSPRKRSGKGCSLSSMAFENITRTKAISF